MTYPATVVVLVDVLSNRDDEVCLFIPLFKSDNDGYQYNDHDALLLYVFEFS